MGCLVQRYFFTALVHVEVYILAVMAFDRYMAVCNPLLYGSKMSRTVCAHLISVTYICGFSVSLSAHCGHMACASVETLKSTTSTVLTLLYQDCLWRGPH